MNLLITGAWGGAKEHIPELEALGHEIAFLQQERDALEDAAMNELSFEDPTLADAICDRIIHNSHIITIKGDSMRKLNAVTD